jgi:hypothetical protein
VRGIGHAAVGPVTAGLDVAGPGEAARRGEESPDWAEALMLAFAPEDPRAHLAALYGRQSRVTCAG